MSMRPKRYCEKCGAFISPPENPCLMCGAPENPPVAFITSPIFDLAVQCLNGVKAWRDSDGNEPFPQELREQIDAVLMAYEVRKNGTFAERLARGKK